MVSAMRDHKANIKTRVDLGNYPYYLMCGLKAIDKNEMAAELSFMVKLIHRENYKIEY